MCRSPEGLTTNGKTLKNGLNAKSDQKVVGGPLYHEAHLNGGVLASCLAACVVGLTGQNCRGQA